MQILATPPQTPTKKTENKIKNALLQKSPIKDLTQTVLGILQTEIKEKEASVSLGLSLRDQYISKLETSKNAVTEEIEEVRRQHQLLQDEYETLKAITTKVSENYFLLIKQYESSEKEKVDLIKEVKQAHLTLEDLKKTYTLLQSTYDTLVIQEKNLQSEANCLGEKHVELKDQYESCKIEQDDLQKQVWKLEDDFGRLTKKYGHLKQNTINTQTNFEKLDNNYIKTQKLIHRVNQNYIKLEQEKKKQGQELNQFRDKLARCKKPIKVISFLLNSVFHTASLFIQILQYTAQKIYKLFFSLKFLQNLS